MRTKKIAVIAATFQEASGLIETCKARFLTLKSPWDMYAASWGTKEILISVTGIGLANTAAATVELVHVFQPDIIVSTGCAGAYPGSGLSLGDIAVATSEILADTGVAVPGGWLSLEEMGLPLLERNGKHYYNEIPLSPILTEHVSELATRRGQTLKMGKFLTVSTCSGTAARGEELFRRFNGICESMEGAAAALIAARYGVDCLEIRGVSNHVEDRDLSRWNIGLAVGNAQICVESYLKEL